MNTIDFPENRTQWFENARFGMFIHWGLYALLGRGEWVWNREQIPRDEYIALADRFNPTDYEPRKWAQLAVDAGMKYMVLTSKHHEGFCLWDSKTCAFNSAKTAAKRDLVADYLDAARDAGLKVGLYYSLGDWYNEDWRRAIHGDDAAWDRFVQYTHELVMELITQYGRIDVLWYDLPQNFSPDQWKSVELNARARAAQPHILINNRAMTTEDFGTPEQHVKASGGGRMWEACMTLNSIWGYYPDDPDYKSPRQVVQQLADVASGAGNLLLNVGPDPRGNIPPRSVDILQRVGQWMQTHGDAIYGSQRHGMTWNLFGRTARKGHTLYLFLSRYHGQRVAIGALQNKALSARCLSNGAELSVEQRDNQTIITGLPDAPPDELLPVVAVELDGPPRQDFTPSLGIADVFPDFPK